MIAFIKRVFGVHPSQIEEYQRFRSNLSKCDERNERLNNIRIECAGVLEAIHAKTLELQGSPILSGMSGEHRLSFGKEIPIVRGSEDN